jgi:hypothetical protein
MPSGLYRKGVHPMNNKTASAQADGHTESSKNTAQSKKEDDNKLDNTKDGARGPEPVSSTQASNATPDA